MKTRISKRLLSAVLSVLMIVTSLPIVTFTAAADETSPEDQVKAAMQRLEDTLSVQGVFTNVAPAYQAYVDCQKALDASIYGGETIDLAAKAQTLSDAVGAITRFTTKKATGVPTFPNSSVSDMQEYVNNGTISQILYSDTATLTSGAFNGDGKYVAFKMCLLNNVVALYDTYDNGVDAVPQINVPVMFDAYKSNSADPAVNLYGGWANNGAIVTAYDKTRNVFAVYPSQDQSGTTDDANWNLIGKWRSGAGADANWNWNWWSDNASYDPAYNAATGCADAGVQNTNKDDASLNLVINKGSYKAGSGFPYTSVERYHSNIMRYVGSAPTGASLVTTIPYWYCSAGDGANSAQDSMSMGGNSMTIINYNYITDKLVEYGNKMKSVDLDAHSEGSLGEYFTAMEAATQWNPNDYITSSSTQACTQSMTQIVNNIKYADTETENSASYAALRTAMSANVRSVYSAGNWDATKERNRYTTESWDAFVTAYENARDIMAACNDSSVIGEGYSDSTAQAKANALTLAFSGDGTAEHPGLVPNIARVNTTALMNLIAVVQNDFIQVFTDDTWNPLVDEIQDAMNTVWQPDGTEQEGETVYGVSAKALELDDEGVNQGIVDGYVTRINTLIKNLRFSRTVVVTTTEGKFSIDSAIALGDTVEDPSYYGNWTTFTTAVATLNDYANNTLPYQEMGVDKYATQLAKLKEEIAKVVTAFHALTKSFMRIEDGEIANAGQFIDMTEMTQSRNSRYYYRFQFSYPDNVILFKTSHDAKSYKFGDALIRFTINHDDNVSAMPNDGLDSVTLNTTLNGTGNDGQLAKSGEFTNKPAALSGTQKTDYPGCLAVDGFSLNNFRFHSQSNNSYDYLGRDNSGTQFYKGADNEAEKLYEVLSQTTGDSANPPNGCTALHPSLKKDCVQTLAGDFNIDTPATNALAPLDAETTVPTSTAYSLTGKYVGAVYCWNVQPSGAWAGYSFFSYKDIDEPINANVTVIDVSYLFDLVSQCNTISGDADLYTASSWANFQQKLVAAQANMNYNILSADQIIAQCQQRYSELFEAYTTGLQLRAFNTEVLAAVNEKTALYNTHNADGIYTADSWAQFETLYEEAYNTIAEGGIYSNANIKEVLASEQTTVDGYASRLRDFVLTKVVDVAADWTSYNVALQNLKNLIQDYALSVTALNTIVSQTADMLYTAYTAAEQAAANGSFQPSINAETATLTELYNTVKADFDNIAEIDYSAAQAYATDYNDLYGNDDMWAGNNETFAYSESVNIPLINCDIQGMLYTNADALDDAIAASLNSKDIRTYTITLNGTVVGTASYGEPVIVDADGTLHNNVADTSENSETADMSDWFYSYSAPSTNGVETNSKYILTAPSYGFIVKGDTFLDTKTANKTDTNYCIKFVARVGGTNKLFDVQYSENHQVKVPSAPSYAGYRFTGFNNGATVGRWLDVDSNMTIIANYELLTDDAYTIHYYDGLDHLYSGDYDESLAPNVDENDMGFLFTARYNELVVLPTSRDDVYCWATFYINPETFIYEMKIVHYGPSYAFYACQDILSYNEDEGYNERGIFSLTYDEYCEVFKSSVEMSDDYSGLCFVDQNDEMIVPEYDYFSVTIPDAVPTVSALENVVSIYDSNNTLEKFSMIGTFTLPEGYEMVETGFLFTTQLGSDLTIENVGTNGIARMKTARYTIGNQFVVNVMAPGFAVSFEYVAYAVIKDSEGNVTTLYSTKGGETNYGA